MNATPNMRVEYVDAETGKTVATADYLDRGYVLPDGRFIWPSFGCGHPIAPPPAPPAKR